MTSEYAIVTNDLQIAAAHKNAERTAAIKGFLPAQIALLEAMRGLEVPVIHLQLVVAQDDPHNANAPQELRYSIGSPGVEMLPEVLGPGDLVLRKPKDSGFADTDLDATLKSLGVRKVIISGMQTQICVQTTAADAHFRGYEVIVPTDAVFSGLPEATEAALEWMAKYCATVIASREIERLVARSVGDGAVPA